MNGSLDDAIRAVALKLPAPLVDKLAIALDDATTKPAVLRSLAVSASPQPAYRRAASAVTKAWAASEPSTTGPTIARLLRMAGSTADELRNVQRVEVVWTGPAVSITTARDTFQAFVDTVRAATKTLICLSFAAYKDKQILAELAEAIDRGVEVLLVLDSEKESSGAHKGEAKDAFDSLGPGAQFYVWPKEKRAELPWGRARFHPKAVIADSSIAFVTSANLTGAAMRHNMELGLRVTGGPIPVQLERHVRELISSGELVRAD